MRNDERRRPAARPGGLPAWAELTTGLCVQRDFPGGHFFVNSARQELLAAVAAELAGAAPGRAAAA